MTSGLIAQMQRLQGWRLVAITSLLILFAVEMIVSGMSLILQGEITRDFLITGFVAASLVAPSSLALINHILDALRQSQIQSLENTIERHRLTIKMAIESAQMDVWELDLVNNAIKYNTARINIPGFTENDPPRNLQVWLSYIHPDDIEEFQRRMQLAMLPGAWIFDYEYRVATGTDAWNWVRTRGGIIQRDATGKPLLAAGGTININERKHIELAMHQAKETYLDIFNTLTESIYILDDTFTFIEVNEGAAKMYGYHRDELIGKNPVAVAAPGLNDMERISQQMHDTARFGHTCSFEFWALRSNGQVFPKEVSVNKGRFFGKEVLIATARDITKRKQAETALVESRRLLISVIDNAPIRVFWKDRESRYLGCNKAFARDAGIDDPKAMIGKDDFQFGWKDQAESYRADDLKVMQSGIPKLSFEEPQTTPDGQQIWLRTSKVPLQNDKGEIIGLLGIYEDITARKQAEAQLHSSEERALNLSRLLRLITDNVTDMIWAKDTNKRYLFANKALCDGLLNARDTDEPVGKDDLFFARRERNSHPDDPEWHTFGELCQDSDAITLAQGAPMQFDEYGNVKGNFLRLDVHKAPFINDQGEVIGVVGSARDVTQQKAIEEKLRLAALVFDNSSEAMFITDDKGFIVEVNPAFTRVTGYVAAEAIGKNPSMLRSGMHEPSFYQSMWNELQHTGHWQGEIWNRRKNGEIFAEWQSINAIYNPDGTVHRYVSLFSDITERKKSEERIWVQANFDPLTGMPNRRMFRDRLMQDLKKAHRAGMGLALMFLDLDRFKEVNDTLGHDVGDALLVEASRRIAACVRESDTVARLGGDEFTVILAELNDRNSVERIAANILHSLSRPFQLGEETAYVSASIGITLYPDDADTLEDMLKNADQAMYVAKNSGRNRFSYFTNAMQEMALYRLYLLNDLRGALGGHQLQLYYQPIVEITTGSIHKAEALLRWNHPQRGLVSPAEFIPLAEESGLIHPIGDWVFAQATAQTLEWSARYGDDFQISVNKSPLQLQTKSDQCQWREHMARTGVSGKNLVIEITEGVLLDNSPQVTSELLAYRDAGIQVAIDDFGTGYSALSYLKKLDIDYVKIDQSFMRNLVNDQSDKALAEAIVVMAHKLGLQVIAEGVETQEQLDLLAAMGCDYAQGFLYARALSPQDFELLMARQKG